MIEITRKIDKLGRIVLPKDFRKKLGLENNADIIISLSEQTITVRKSSNICRLCGKPLESNQISLCSPCIEKIKQL